MMRPSSTVELIKSDLYRYYARTDMRSFLKGWLFNRGFNYMMWLRIAQSGIPLLSLIAAVVLRFKQRWFGICIPRQTRIGAGFYIGHAGPCIVSTSAIIGRNVNISQFVTIGSNHGQAAVVGDNVYIGPNCVLIEDITIGNNVTIGAGSIVTRSIPDNCTAAGNPARVLNQKYPGRYVVNRWPVQED